MEPELGGERRAELYLSELLETLPKMAAVSAQQLKLERYETLFGIHDHSMNDDFEHPFSVVELHPAEDTLTHSRLFERIQQYHEREINKYWSLSLIEFLNLPTFVVLHLLELSFTKQREEFKIKRESAEAVKQAMNGEQG